MAFQASTSSFHGISLATGVRLEPGMLSAHSTQLIKCELTVHRFEVRPAAVRPGSDHDGAARQCSIGEPV
jgi:hypothetical protein